MESAISVMELSVSHLSAIGLDVDSIWDHGVSIGAEYGWLIHVVPE